MSSNAQTTGALLRPRCQTYFGGAGRTKLRGYPPSPEGSRPPHVVALACPQPGLRVRAEPQLDRTTDARMAQAHGVQTDSERGLERVLPSQGGMARSEP